MHPRLLSTLVLVDPVIHKHSSFQGPKNKFTQASTFRRDIWPSRADATSAFNKNKFYQSWDSRVLDQWITYGLRDLPTEIYPDTASYHKNSEENPKAGEKGPPVTLTTTKHQEVFTFLRPNFDGLSSDGNPIVDRTKTPDLDPASGDSYPFYRSEMVRTFENLPYVRPSVLYVFGGKSSLSLPEARRLKMLRTGIAPGGSGGAAQGKVKEVVVERAGHLLPMEAISETVAASTDWIAKQTELWSQTEEEWRHQWENKSLTDRTMISEEWKRQIVRDPIAERRGKL